MKIFLVILGCLLLVGCVCFYVGWGSFSPREITVVETKYLSLPPVIKEVPVRVVQTVEIPIEVPQIVWHNSTVEVEVNKPLRPFASKQDFAIWMVCNRLPDAKRGQCVDTALTLIAQAERDGFQLFMEVINDGEPEGHAVVSTVVGNEIYFGEPTNGYIWLAGTKK